MGAEQRCQTCRAGIAPGAGWCPLCYQPVPAGRRSRAWAQAVPGAAAQAVPGAAAQAVPGPAAQADPGAAGRPDPGHRDAAGPGWPCPACPASVAWELPACHCCGAGFLSPLAADPLPGAGRLGWLLRLPRAARLGAALVTAVLLASALALASALL